MDGIVPATAKAARGDPRRFRVVPVLQPSSLSRSDLRGCLLRPARRGCAPGGAAGPERCASLRPNARQAELPVRGRAAAPAGAALAFRSSSRFPSTVRRIGGRSARVCRRRLPGGQAILPAACRRGPVVALPAFQLAQPLQRGFGAFAAAAVGGLLLIRVVLWTLHAFVGGSRVHGVPEENPRTLDVNRGPVCRTMPTRPARGGRRAHRGRAAVRAATPSTGRRKSSATTRAHS